MKRAVLILVFLVIVIGVAYHLLIYYDNNFRHGRMWETPAVRPHENPLLIMEAGIVPTGGGEAVLRATPADQLTSPLETMNPSDIEQGKAGYKNYCAQCHGEHFDGKGTVGQSFAPLPADLRSEKVQRASEGALFKEISYGIPDGRQPALATTIRIKERWQIIAFIKSLGNRHSPSK